MEVSREQLHLLDLPFFMQTTPRVWCDTSSVPGRQALKLVRVHHCAHDCHCYPVQTESTEQHSSTILHNMRS